MSDKKRLLKSAALGSACGLLSGVVIMCVIAAAMLASGSVFQGMTDYIMLAPPSLGALAGGFVAAKLNRGAGLIAGAAAALIMLAALTVTAMLKGNVSVSPLILFRLAGMLLGGCIGGALGIGERKKNKI